MTRINIIPPSELTDKHLGAEYMELPRVFGPAHKAMLRGEKPDDKQNPKEYVLGEGHVRFFYNKLGYLEKRFKAIVEECKARGRSCQYESVPECYKEMPVGWKGDYQPTEQDMALNRARIADRLGNAS